MESATNAPSAVLSLLLLMMTVPLFWRMRYWPDLISILLSAKYFSAPG